MSWKGIVKVTFPSHLQTLMALFPKSKVLKGLVLRSDSSSGSGSRVLGPIYFYKFFGHKRSGEGNTIGELIGDLKFTGLPST